MISENTELYASERPHYVVGFLFLDRKRQVVLIRKDKPEWQAGKLNGIGGKVEKGESAIDAMSREWKEETGEHRVMWDEFLQIDFPLARVTFFRAFDSESTAKTNEAEMVVRADVSTLPFSLVACRFAGVTHHLPVIPNLRWIIPLALSGETAIASQYHA